MLRSYPPEMHDLVQRFTFEKLKLCSRQVVSLRELMNAATLDVTVDLALSCLVINLRTMIAANRVEARQQSFTVRYPKTWWQAFKKRWFRDWALRRWPVVYREVVQTFTVSTTYNVCPHIDCTGHGNCIEFLRGEVGSG